MNSADEEATTKQAETLRDAINFIHEDISTVLMASYAANLKFGENEIAGYVQVYDSDEELKQMNVVQTRTDGRELTLDADSVFLSEKLSELLGVKVGDEITLESQNEESATIIVSGIFEKYINHEIYISMQYYEELFGESANKNSVVIKGDVDEDILQDAVLNLENVSGITLNSSISSSFDSITTSVDIVVLVIIVSAAALAFVVLGNLASINIGERKREIATLKVLGFNHKETKDYIFKENMVLTLFGALGGIVLGIFAHYFIITQVEMDFIMFIRIVSLPSVIYSVVLTFVFSIAVNRFMLAKLKKIDMIESLKSVE